MRRSSFLSIGLLSGATLLAQGKPADAPAGEGPLEARAEGALLTYKAVELVKGKKAEKAEIQTLEKLEATLRVEKSIGARRVTLPPGEYAVRIEPQSEDGLSLVIEKPGAPKEEAPEKSARPASGKRRQPGRGGEGQEGSRPGGALEREEGKPGEAPAPAGDEPGDEQEGPAPAEKKRPAAPERLKVPLKLGSAARVSSLGAELKLADKGSRLRITLRAGATAASASIRFGDER